MKLRSVFFAGGLAVAALGGYFRSHGSAPDPTVNVRGDDPAMLAAYQKARVTFHDFLSAYRDPPPGARMFEVKVPLASRPDGRGYAVVQPGPHPGETVEYFWVKNLAIVGGGLRGQLDNDGETVTAARVGQSLDFAATDVADWMYLQNGRMIGNATMCPEMAMLPDDQKRALLARVGASCP